jgi:hypothetical protein
MNAVLLGMAKPDIFCVLRQVKLIDRKELPSLDDGPDTVSTLRSYSWDALPAKIGKKYRYASRFVDLIRSKTPKVKLASKSHW